MIFKDNFGKRNGFNNDQNIDSKLVTGAIIEQSRKSCT